MSGPGPASQSWSNVKSLCAKSPRGSGTEHNNWSYRKQINKIIFDKKLGETRSKSLWLLLYQILLRQTINSHAVKIQEARSNLWQKIYHHSEHTLLPFWWHSNFEYWKIEISKLNVAKNLIQVSTLKFYSLEVKVSLFVSRWRNEAANVHN